MCPANISVLLVVAVYSRITCIIAVVGWMSKRLAVDFFPLELILADVFSDSKMTQQHSMTVETQEL